MLNSVTTETANRRDDILGKLLVLLGLTAFTVTEPLLTIFGANPGIFYFHNVENAAVIAIYAVTVALVPPLFLWLAILIAGLISRILAAALFYGLIFLLGALWLIQLLKWSLDLEDPLLLIIFCVTFGLLFLLMYRRWPIVSACLKLCAIAPFLVVGVFLVSSETAGLMHTVGSNVQRQASDSGSPTVVFILLDEFPTLGLFDENESIDRLRFPNLAELSEQATWYRHYTVLNGTTRISVPSILSGQNPQPAPASFVNYPNNLFSLLAPTHETVAFETITGMCGWDWCSEQAPGSAPARSAPELQALFAKTALIWWRRVLPTDTGEVALDDFEETFAPPNATAPTLVGGSYTPVIDRETASRHHASTPERLEQFVASFVPGRSALYFMHLQLPHVPWRFHHTGEQYSMPDEKTDKVFRNRDGGAWVTQLREYRFLMQAQHTDRLLGKVFSRLKSLGMWDQALVLITADHGRSFRLNAPGRKLFDKTLDAIAYTPLFIKKPYQQVGEINDSNMMAYDIIPTVADILGIEVPWETEGFAAGNAGIAKRGDKKVAFYSTSKAKAGQRQTFSDKENYPEYASRWIGQMPESGDPLALLNQSLGLNDFLHHSPDEFDVQPGGHATVNKLHLLQQPEAGTAPLGVIMGSLDFEPTGDKVLMSVNDRFVTGSPLINFKGVDHAFIAMLPPATLKAENKIGIYLVQADGLVALSLSE